MINLLCYLQTIWYTHRLDTLYIIHINSLSDFVNSLLYVRVSFNINPHNTKGDLKLRCGKTWDQRLEQDG